MIFEQITDTARDSVNVILPDFNISGRCQAAESFVIIYHIIALEPDLYFFQKEMPQAESITVIRAKLAEIIEVPFSIKMDITSYL